MFHIRSYDQQFHPDSFKGSLLGWWIIALNWLRWRLEVHVQRLVLKWAARNAGMPKAAKRRVMHMFDLDVAAERLAKEQTSPDIAHTEPPPQIVRAERYSGGRPAKVMEDGAGMTRPVPMDNLIGKYAFPYRAKRYALGDRFATSDPDGDFVPLEDTDGDALRGDEVGRGPRRVWGAGAGVRRSDPHDQAALEGEPGAP